jgi:ParB family transcriptional regulator, chromosome partitioning protein
LSRPDFRAAAARRLSEDRELPPAIVSLLSPDAVRRSTGVKVIPVDRIEANPDQPRLAFDEASLEELASSIREHGVLQPILVRPIGENHFQLIAGERRWRACKLAGQATIPALVVDIDDDTALEIAIIENLQREDLSPLDEALIYAKMIHQHGYSIRKLAQKLGKDKGYLENRLRLADAPAEIRDLVSVRKDTLSHAYELLKVEDPRKRKHLADLVARGELSLVKLREKIDPNPKATPSKAAKASRVASEPVTTAATVEDALSADASAGWPAGQPKPLDDDSLIAVRGRLNDVMVDLVNVLQSDVMRGIDEVDRQNLAKYLMIVKVRLENAIGLVRRGGQA